MSARIARRTRLIAATTVALATLALTACDNGDGESGVDEGRAPASSERPAQSDGPEDAGESTARPADETSREGADGGASDTPETTAPTDSDGGNPECDGSNTKVTATVVDRPLNHLLLTVTNTGPASCDLIGYPTVRFGEAQAVPPVDESTKPQAVITLLSGDSGYGGVRLSAADGSGTNGYRTTSLTVLFGQSDTRSTPSLPEQGVYVDDSLQVTYWQHSPDKALN